MSKFWVDSQNGNPSNSGTSLVDAKDKFQDGFNLLSSPGDELWLTNGSSGTPETLSTYVTMTKTGTNANWYKVVGCDENGDELPNVFYKVQGTSTELLFPYNSDFLELRNIAAVGNTTAGKHQWYIQGGNCLRLVNCYAVNGAGDGFYVIDIGMRYFERCGAFANANNGLETTAGWTTLKHCAFIDNTVKNLHIGNCYFVTCQDCIFDGNASTANVYSSGADYLDFNRCIITRGDSHGLHLDASTSISKIFNSIVAFNLGNGLKMDSGTYYLLEDYNITYDNTLGHKSGLIVSGNNTVDSNPLFTNISTGNYDFTRAITAPLANEEIYNGPNLASGYGAGLNLNYISAGLSAIRGAGGGGSKSKFGLPLGIKKGLY